MTGAKLIVVREAQEVIEQRKVPEKDTVKRKGRYRAKKESSSESEAYLDITDERDLYNRYIATLRHLMM